MYHKTKENSDVNTPVFSSSLITEKKPAFINLLGMNSQINMPRGAELDICAKYITYLNPGTSHTSTEFQSTQILSISVPTTSSQEYEISTS